MSLLVDLGSFGLEAQAGATIRVTANLRPGRSRVLGTVFFEKT
jgi:hypothetical protein